MFDDDIEHVRLQAMRVLGKIAQGRVLRGEQVLSILTELLVRQTGLRASASLNSLLLFLLEPVVRYSVGAARCLTRSAHRRSRDVVQIVPSPRGEYPTVQNGHLFRPTVRTSRSPSPLHLSSEQMSTRAGPEQ